MASSDKTTPHIRRQALALARADASQLAEGSWRQVISDYWELTKPEISLVVVLSSIAGFLLGSPDRIDPVVLVTLVIGGFLTSGGVGALNQYFEREMDGDMRRTANRPIPAGRVSPLAASRFGTLMVVAGVALLCPLTNPLTGVLAALTAVLYVFVYTPLKRKTTLNTIIGTVPGALPALGGWTAATGNLHLGGWILFGILVAWQMPHFLSLAWMYRKDYARAGLKMTPSVHGLKPTMVQTIAYSVALLPLGVWPWVLGLTGALYGVGAVVLGVWFLIPVYRFWRRPTSHTAKRVLLASVAYIPALLLLLIADRLI